MPYEGITEGTDIRQPDSWNVCAEKFSYCLQSKQTEGPKTIMVLSPKHLVGPKHMLSSGL